MKKKQILSLIIIFIILLSPILIKADSGFDSSWDSGSSWGGSSDWSSDWGSSSNWSSSSNSSTSYGGFYFSGLHIVTTMMLTFLIFIFYQSFAQKIKNNTLPKIIMFPPYFIFIFFIFGFINLIIAIITLSILVNKSSKNSNSNQSSNIPPRLSQEDINKYLPNFNIEKFNSTVFNIYKNIQEAWMDFDLDTIRDLVSDEIYNMYSMQLSTLQVKGQKNIMENIHYITNYISSITINNNLTTINTVLKVTCNDYVIDNNDKVVRGNKCRTLTYTYLLTFTKYTNPTNITNCPNCGAKIDINASGKCEYCNATIINEEEKWIMTKKQMLVQK
ncbi:MAG: Tim44 domain-containing protein [Bacilli bacterium]|nr:Tim44 domain-containing protein [Bacilli bacterium]